MRRDRTDAMLADTAPDIIAEMVMQLVADGCSAQADALFAARGKSGMTI